MRRVDKTSVVLFIVTALIVQSILGCSGSSTRHDERQGDQHPSGGASAGASGSDTRGGRMEPPRPTYCGGIPCASPDACCVATGECYDPTEPSACAQPPPDDDPFGRVPCASNSQCTDDEFCMLETGLCRGTGHCQRI